MTPSDRSRQSSRDSTWRPSLGSWCEGPDTHFRVWAPDHRKVEVVIESRGGRTHTLRKREDGTFAGTVSGVGAGDLYRYRLDGDGSFPDPASRFQPDGVHGASQIVAANRFTWPERPWSGVSLQELVVYELHVGTFSPSGTFAGAMEQLPILRDLGITAIELMPVADFPGGRNWGYDGVALFAPARCYGAPDDLRQLVDRAHELGLGVLLDVVYNHLGPDGAYLGAFSSQYFSKRHKTPWGAAMNLDGPGSERVRELFVENALHWIHEYRVDGLRLDATHALIDDGPRHFLAELSARIHETTADSRSHPVLLIAEDHRNLEHMVRPESEGGWGLDAVWADDFHHQMRRCLAGDHEGYYSDFSGSMTDLAATLRQGWFFTGQRSGHLGEARGTDPKDMDPERFVLCLQNHDQVGNRAFGERLHHQIDLAAYRAATVLLLLAPQTPLLFMGQEWAASTPFLFFTDHKPDLGKLVTKGRRREFGGFSAFSDPAVRETIPDPQAIETFTASQLVWSERNQGGHAGTLRLYRALLHLRRDFGRTLRLEREAAYSVRSSGSNGIILKRHGQSQVLLIVACLSSPHSGPVEVEWTSDLGALDSLERTLDTEEDRFCADPAPVAIGASTIRFQRPGALILRMKRA